LESDLIEIKPGMLYRVSVYGFSIKGDMQLYLQFYDSTGTRIGVKFGGVSGPSKNWTLMTQELIAPENAEG
jgi:hypothetical protein